MDLNGHFIEVSARETLDEFDTKDTEDARMVNVIQSLNRPLDAAAVLALLLPPLSPAFAGSAT